MFYLLIIVNYFQKQNVFFDNKTNLHISAIIHTYLQLLIVTIINIRVINIPIFKFFLLKYHRVYFPAKVNIKVQKFHLT